MKSIKPKKTQNKIEFANSFLYNTNKNKIRWTILRQSVLRSLTRLRRISNTMASLVKSM